MSTKSRDNDDSILEKIEALVENEAVPQSKDGLSDMALKYYESQEDVLMKVMNVLKNVDKEFKGDLKDVADEEKKLYDSYVKVTNKIANDDYEIGVYLDSIKYTLQKLDKTLHKLSDADNKAKIYIERARAIHEIKKILHKAGKLVDYEEDVVESVLKD